MCTRILVVLNNGCGPLGIHVIPTPLMGKGGGEKGGGDVEKAAGAEKADRAEGKGGGEKGEKGAWKKGGKPKAEAQ